MVINNSCYIISDNLTCYGLPKSLIQIFNDTKRAHREMQWKWVVNLVFKSPLIIDAASIHSFILCVHIDVVSSTGSERASERKKQLMLIRLDHHKLTRIPPSHTLISFMKKTKSISSVRVSRRNVRKTNN